MVIGIDLKRANVLSQPELTQFASDVSTFHVWRAFLCNLSLGSAAYPWVYAGSSPVISGWRWKLKKDLNYSEMVV